MPGPLKCLGVSLGLVIRVCTRIAVRGDKGLVDVGIVVVWRRSVGLRFWFEFGVLQRAQRIASRNIGRRISSVHRRLLGSLCVSIRGVRLTRRLYRMVKARGVNVRCGVAFHQGTIDLHDLHGLLLYEASVRT